MMGLIFVDIVSNIGPIYSCNLLMVILYNYYCKLTYVIIIMLCQRVFYNYTLIILITLADYLFTIVIGITRI